MVAWRSALWHEEAGGTTSGTVAGAATDTATALARRDQPAPVLSEIVFAFRFKSSWTDATACRRAAPLPGPHGMPRGQLALEPAA